MNETSKTQEKSPNRIDFNNIPKDISEYYPTSFKYFKRRFALKSKKPNWRGIYIKLFQLIYEDYSEKIPVNISFKGNEQIDFGFKGSMQKPIRISNGLYLEVNISYAQMLENLAKLLKLCDINYDKISIYYTSLNTREGKEISDNFKIDSENIDSPKNKKNKIITDAIKENSLIFSKLPIDENMEINFLYWAEKNDKHPVDIDELIILINEVSRILNIEHKLGEPSLLCIKSWRGFLDIFYYLINNNELLERISILSNHLNVQEFLDLFLEFRVRLKNNFILKEDFNQKEVLKLLETYLNNLEITVQNPIETELSQSLNSIQNNLEITEKQIIKPEESEVRTKETTIIKTESASEPDLLKINKVSPSMIENIQVILSNDFTRGYRLNQKLAYNTFKRRYKRKFKEELILSSQELEDILKEIGVSNGKFVYSNDNLFSSKDITKLKNFIIEVLKERTNQTLPTLSLYNKFLPKFFSENKNLIDEEWFVLYLKSNFSDVFEFSEDEIKLI